MKDEWISVNDTMPEEGVEVIAYGKGTYLIGTVYDSYGRYYCDAEDTMVEDVTHWMPLPEPPKP